MIGKILIELKAEMEKIATDSFDHTLSDYASYREQVGVRKGIGRAIDLILASTKEKDGETRKSVSFE